MGDSPMGSGISEEDKSNNGDKDVSRVNSPEKMGAGEFWSTKLKAAKFVVAPMVDQSELAWRMLSRKYGAQLCFTPMLHASVFIRNRAYQIEALLSCPEDRPLIVQFCANDPDTLLTAAKIAQGHCDAIDINLGCPQKIAKKGHYGAFLQDEWDLLHRMVNLCHTNLKVPITCKIRVFESLERTVQYAQMLERAGCQLLTVHGRTREQKGPFTGTANWDYIQAVRENVKIPVFANGNIQYLEDVERCLKQTGVNGIMSAEGNLHNPALFKGLNLPVWQMAVEYLEMVEKYPCSPSYIRGHLFKLFHHAVQVHQDIREEVARAKTVECFKIATQHLKEKCQVDVEQYAKDPDSFKTDLPHPYWICQPYVRPGPQDSAKVKEEGTNEKEMLKKRPLEELKIDEIGLSKNKLKKKMRNPTKNFDMNWKTKYEMCEHCPNPKGKKCVYGMCKNCCRMKTYTETLDCASHNFSFKTRHKQ